MTIDCSKLTPGTICVRRDGKLVKYVGPADDDFIFNHGGEVQWHLKNGRCFFIYKDPKSKYEAITDSAFDIISIKKPTRVLDCWLGVYQCMENPDKTFTVFFEKDGTVPQLNCRNKLLARLHIVREYEEGEGL